MPIHKWEESIYISIEVIFGIYKTRDEVWGLVSIVLLKSQLRNECSTTIYVLLTTFSDRLYCLEAAELPAAVAQNFHP